MDIKSENLIGKRIICEDLEIGKVKDLIMDANKWKVTHLDVELTKDAAEVVLGVRKGGIRNLLAVSAVNGIEEQITLKVSKGQLRIYLVPPKLHS